MNENDQQFFYHDNNMGVSNFLFFMQKSFCISKKEKIKSYLNCLKYYFLN